MGALILTRIFLFLLLSKQSLNFRSNIASSSAETLNLAREGETIVHRSVKEVKEIAQTVDEPASFVRPLGPLEPLFNLLHKGQFLGFPSNDVSEDPVNFIKL